MEASELVAWLNVGLRMLASLAVLCVALAVVRPRLPRAGWTLAAAAGFELLASCCLRIAFQGVGRGSRGMDDVQTYLTGLSVLALLHTLLVGALIVAAVVVMAREARGEARG